MRSVLSVILGCLLCTALLVAAEAAGPRTWRVGPDRELRAPSAAAAVARDGDTVLIDAGTYVGDVATWTTLAVLDWTTKRFTDAGISSARLEAQVLLAGVVGCEQWGEDRDEHEE